MVLWFIRKDIFLDIACNKDSILLITQAIITFLRIEVRESYKVKTGLGD